MRKLLALSIFFSSLVSAQTVINYEDGSTYTLGGDEQIYISTPNSVLFKRKLYKNKNTYFIAQKPWDKRDYVAQSTDGMEVGSHEWCKAYEPWSEGYSFNMQAWKRQCDTNNDGAYDENDERWSE
jgi:hypothetical protein